MSNGIPCEECHEQPATRANGHRQLCAECMPACRFCGQSQTVVNSDGVEFSRLVNTPHWTGSEYVRVDRCNACWYRVNRAPSRPRARRTHVPATDYNALVAFSGKGSI